MLGRGQIEKSIAWFLGIDVKPLLSVLHCFWVCQCAKSLVTDLQDWTWTAFALFSWKSLQRPWLQKPRSRGADEPGWLAWWTWYNERVWSTWTWKGSNEGWSYEWTCTHKVFFIFKYSMLLILLVLAGPMSYSANWVCVFSYYQNALLLKFG